MNFFGFQKKSERRYLEGYSSGLEQGISYGRAQARWNEVPHIHFNITVKIKRNLRFSFTAGNPVSFCQLSGYSKSLRHFGLSVCKRGDRYDICQGLRLALENLLQDLKIVLDANERFVLGYKFSQEIKKIGKQHDLK